jgi:hypothetical protein
MGAITTSDDTTPEPPNANVGNVAWTCVKPGAKWLAGERSARVRVELERRMCVCVCVYVCVCARAHVMYEA